MSGIFPSTALAEPNIFICSTFADSLNKKFIIRRDLPHIVTIINILGTPINQFRIISYSYVSVVVPPFNFSLWGPLSDLISYAALGRPYKVRRAV